MDDDSVGGNFGLGLEFAWNAHLVGVVLDYILVEW